MALEMLFSFALTIMAGYGLIYVNATVSATVYTDPLGAAFWPRTLLTLIIILLVINLVQVYRKTPQEKRNLESITKIDFKGLVHNRLTWGILLMFSYAALLPVAGFLPASLLMCILLSFLLGEKRLVVLIGFSLLIVVMIYIIFYKGMSIQLPRGTIPFLRNFSLAVEKFLRNLGK